MRLSNFVAVFCVSSLLATGAFSAEMKIAIVDLQKALQTVDAGKKAKANLEKEFNEKKKTIQSEEEAIKKMSEDFKKQSMVLSDEAKIKKQNELQERLMKYRELVGKSQVQMQERERQATEPIIGKLRTIVDEIGAKKGYSIIFEKNDASVLYLQQRDDLTDDVIAAFNKKNG